MRKTLSFRFKRGYRFRNFAGQLQNSLTDLPASGEIRMPLAGSATPPLRIKPGSVVRAGEILGRNDEKGLLPLLSPVSGKVKKIITDPEGMPHLLLIESDGTQDWDKPALWKPDWKSQSREELSRLVFESGAAGLGPEGIPALLKNTLQTPEEVREIFVTVNAGDCFPDCLELLTTGLAESLSILLKILPSAKVRIVWPSTESRILKSSGLPDDPRVFVHTATPKYPFDSIRHLSRLILNKPLPHDAPALTEGILGLGLRDLLTLREAVSEGKPVIDRIVGLAGPGWTGGNPYLRARIGTPLSAIISGRTSPPENLRFVHNSPMESTPPLNASSPVSLRTDRIIAMQDNAPLSLFPFIDPGFVRDSRSPTFLSNWLPLRRRINPNLHGEERACISCGYCVEVCPAGIMPNLIFNRLRGKLIDEDLVRFGTYSCVDCGLCTYVCPSKINVSDAVASARKELARQGLSDPAKKNGGPL